MTSLAAGLVLIAGLFQFINVRFEIGVGADARARPISRLIRTALHVGLAVINVV